MSNTPTRETSLTDFMDGVPPSNPDIPPRIKKRRRITFPFKGKMRTAGWVGPVPERDQVGYITTRDSWEHRVRYYHKDSGGCYAISDRVIQRLDDKDVGVVLIAEEDTNTVLEYPFWMFRNGEFLPASYLESANDPQRYRTRAEAVEAWQDHLGHVYLPRDADIEGIE